MFERKHISVPRTCVVFYFLVFGQNQQALGQAERSNRPSTFTIEYVAYRQTQWETKAVKEGPYERPNKGGLVFVYFTNTSDENQRIGVAGIVIIRLCSLYANVD